MVMTLQTCHLDIDPTLPGERKGIQERFDEIQKEKQNSQEQGEAEQKWEPPKTKGTLLPIRCR